MTKLTQKDIIDKYVTCNYCKRVVQKGDGHHCKASEVWQKAQDEIIDILEQYIHKLLFDIDTKLEQLRNRKDNSQQTKPNVDNRNPSVYSVQDETLAKKTTEWDKTADTHNKEKPKDD
jgi:hypothetical protein